MIAAIPIFLKLMPEPLLSSFLITLGSAFFSFLGIIFFSFLGVSFLTSLVSDFEVPNFLAGSFIPASLCLKPSVAVLLKEGLAVFVCWTLSFSFLSLAVLLYLDKSKLPIFPSKPLSELLDLPENIDELFLNYHLLKIHLNLISKKIIFQNLLNFLLFEELFYLLLNL